MRIDRERLAAFVICGALTAGLGAVGTPLAYADPPEQKFTCADAARDDDGTYAGDVEGFTCVAADGKPMKGRGNVNKVKIVDKKTGAAWKCRSAIVGEPGRARINEPDEDDEDKWADYIEGHDCK